MDWKTAIQDWALPAARRAGEEIMAVYACGTEDWEVERKADDTPLTLADRRAHTAIAGTLAPAGLPLLSEEGAHVPFAARRDWERFWLVDPLDGTKEFLKRNGEFTVNIALIERGRPVAGVVYAPASGRLYCGAEGFGIWGGCEPVAAARPFRVVASRSHLSSETEAYIALLRAEHPALELVAAGSSLKICLVAAGEADVYPRFAPTMEWDTAAGDAVLRAAGGCIVDARTRQPLVYNKEDLHNPWFIAARACRLP
ncbi:MAG: 3'(2'),5'-bisphosphate nucleotidase CysQ [Alloprevotella sp.]|nr:3'(2'),5'-bisphosphate nucleotidase CysQ [Alloprevotella sp.]